MTENAQLWFNQESITASLMACARHKTRTECGPGGPFTWITAFTVNTLMEKMYQTMPATGKVIKHNLRNTKEKDIFH